mmetsp:Transcript_6847/g.16809  ORF Transcript_6847/g.16809 Transcript_6847/m.16809 type:complete len:90 (+) Transcript_6847:554-823(+)
MDEDGSGRVDVDELTTALNHLGIPVTEEHICALAASKEQITQGFNFHEFLYILSHLDCDMTGAANRIKQGSLGVRGLRNFVKGPDRVII